MSRGRLDARLERLESGSAAARALGREIVALVEQYAAEFGDITELLPLFGLAPAPATEGGDL